MTLADFLWGWPMLCLLLLVGLLLTVHTRGIQFRRLPFALRSAFGGETKRGSVSQGDMSPFATLCTALSATIGTGNIVGVSSAIAIGGPGALFWMLVAALLGMATKYAEGLLAVRYRTFDLEGKVLGGPFCYIEQGLSRRFPGRKFPKLLAGLFACAGTAAGLFGIGTVTQSGGIVSAADLVLPSEALFTLLGHPVTPVALVTGSAVTLLTALVLVGGVKRISRVSEIMVPLMAALYITLTLTVLLTHWSKLPSAISLIFRSAFDLRALGGAVTGATVMTVIRTGIKRGIFANEAGLGSTPIAAAAAVTDNPVRQGLVSMSGTFVDTILLCTMTGLAVTVTGAWEPLVTGGDLEGFAITAFAWEQGLPLSGRVCSLLLSLCLTFFAFTSILGWHYYAERCFSYLTGGRGSWLFTGVYLIAVAAGAVLDPSLTWALADLLNGLMALPNLLALFLLRREIGDETRRAEHRYRSGRPSSSND